MANPDQERPPENERIVDRIASSRHPLIRVLAVDDELAASKFLSIILGPPDYYCAMASNGEEALLALQRERFDAVISDLRMPGISVMQLLGEVRRRHPHVAFLVTTGVNDVDVGVQASWFPIGRRARDHPARGRGGCLTCKL
jgi:CheY-like chemotaxis protein